MNQLISSPNRGPYALSAAALLTALGAFVFADVNQDPAGSADIDTRYAVVSRQHVLLLLEELRKQPGLFPEVLQEELEIRANALAEWSSRSRKDDRTALPRALVRQAEGDIRLAKLRLEKAKSLRDPENDTLVKKRELELELAKLFLEKANQPAFQRSETEQLWWSVVHLASDVLELRIRTAQR